MQDPAVEAGISGISLEDLEEALVLKLMRKPDGLTFQELTKLVRNDVVILELVERARSLLNESRNT